MGRKTNRGKAQLAGVVCYADDDPLAEVSIVTDYGQEFLVEPVGVMSNPFRWIDTFVHASGQLVWRNGQRYLRVDRIQELPDEGTEFSPYDADYDWDSTGYWDDE